jgi:cyclophilin family peptidyl-prolyl cis-trans isomerase
VGTEKRARQKANRQARLDELAKQQRNQTLRRRVLTWGGLIVLFVVAAVVISQVFGGDEDEPEVEAGAGTTVAASATSAADTTASTATSTPGTAGAFTYGTGPCPPAAVPAEPTTSFSDAPQLCIDPAKTYAATITTNHGEFTVALDAAAAPGTVNNFVTLARYGYYNGTECHRIITDFVVQCGRPTNGDEAAPGYTIPDELPAEGSYVDGALAMANTGAPNSGGGQFFIITGAQGQALPPQYSLFGQVTSGLDTTVQTLEDLADPDAENGVPPREQVLIESVTITES